MTPHDLELDENGWRLVCTMACPGDLTQCEVVKLIRAFRSSPDNLVGKFEAWAEPMKGGEAYKLIIGRQLGPGEGRPHFSKQTSYTWPLVTDGVDFGQGSTR